MIITTTGVYGNTEDEFFNKLSKEKIDVFIDVRQRRGMRGKRYSFVNSNYLQKKLKELDILYLYVKELSPTKEMRNCQKKQDVIDNNSKSSRDILGKEFIEMYNEFVLMKFDFENIIKEYSGKKILFFCVEEKHFACHRSLIFNHFKKLGVQCYFF